MGVPGCLCAQQAEIEGSVVGNNRKPAIEHLQKLRHELRDANSRVDPAGARHLGGDAVNLGDVVGDGPAVRLHDEVEAAEFGSVVSDEQRRKLDHMGLLRVVVRELADEAGGFSVEE